MAVNLNNASFLKSAADPKQFISSSLPAVVFAGKSNVGKSSVINCVLNRKNFAKVGNTPGKTIHVNYFDIDGKMHFIDLPGYGFAAVSRDEKARWSNLMESFFSEPERIHLGVLIVDARHKPTRDDIMMAKWFFHSGRDFIILANKCDKLKKSELEANLELIRESFPLVREQILPFSAENGMGRETLVKRILSTQ